MSKKLLLSDDSITIQKVVELVLSEKDFDITATNNGEEALTKLDEFVPDIVLADIEMPKVNGYELCKQIKGRQPTKNTPVMLLAGAFEPIDESKAKEVGADNFIVKPFESQELLDKIDTLLAAPSLEEFPPMEEELTEEFMKEEEKEEVAELEATEMMKVSDIQPLEEQLEEKMEEEISMEEKVEEKDELEEPRIKEGTEIQDLAETQPIDETIIFENEEDLNQLDEISLEESAEEELGTDISTKEISEELEKVPEEAKEIEDFDVSLESVLENKDLEETVQEPVEAPITEDVKSYELPEVEMPGKEEVLSMLQDNLGEKVSDLLSSIDNEKISSILEATVKESVADHVNRNLEGINSDLVHKTANEAVLSKVNDILKQVDLKDNMNQMFSSIELPEVEMPGKEEIFSLLQDNIGEKISDVLSSIDNKEMSSMFKDTMKESIRDHVNGNLREMNKEEIATLYKDAMEESIKEQINQNLSEINNELLNKSFNDTLTRRIDELTKGMTIEETMNPMISSTLKGIYENLTEELLRMTKEITEQNIRSIFEEKIPSLKTEVENIIWEVLPDIAEQLIKKEIEEIKAATE